MVGFVMLTALSKANEVALAELVSSASEHSKWSEAEPANESAERPPRAYWRCVTRSESASCVKNGVSDGFTL